MTVMTVSTVRGDFNPWLWPAYVTRAHALYLLGVLVSCVVLLTLLDNYDHGKKSHEDGAWLFHRPAMEHSDLMKTRTTRQRSGNGFALVFSQYSIKVRKMAAPESKPYFEPLNGRLRRGIPDEAYLSQLAPFAVVKMGRKKLSNEVNSRSSHPCNGSSHLSRTVAVSPLATLLRHLVISRLKNATVKRPLGFGSAYNAGDVFGPRSLQEIVSVVPRNKFPPFLFSGKNFSKGSERIPYVPEAGINPGRSERIFSSGNHPAMLFFSMLNAFPKGRPAFANIDNRRSWEHTGDRSQAFRLPASMDMKQPVDVETSYNINVLTVEGLSQDHEKARSWHLHSDRFILELMVFTLLLSALLSWSWIAVHSRKKKCVSTLFPLARV